MLFSEHFGIDGTEAADWFDPILDTDTRLFVDPFLIFKEGSGVWGDAHVELVDYFDRAFKLLAGYQDRQHSLQYKRVLHLMTFPEPQEICLGYVGTGTRGSGSGAGLARAITEAMRQAINRGLVEGMRHFEELGILVDGIERDRISDIAVSILKRRFIVYTQQIAKDLSIPAELVAVPNSALDLLRMRWEPESFYLPRNPYNGRAVLLIPKRFLRELPTLNSKDWYDYAEPMLRDDVNLTIMQNVNAEEIVRLARYRVDLVRRWTVARESRPANPYDIDRDPQGYHNWQAFATRMVSDNPLRIPRDASIDDVVEAIVKKFKHYVEHERGWILLYNDDTGKPKREESVQLLLKGIVQHYCIANGIRLDREVYLGRGPVDFAFTRSAFERVLLEIKKMSSSKFWHGLEVQLTSYLESDDCEKGWYLAVRYDDKPRSIQRTRDLPTRTSAATDETGFSLRSDWIDARPKASASRE